MVTPNRAALLTKIHKVLKKHYASVAPPGNRTVLEHLLYACCLENAAYEKADEAFAKLQQSYFDWNEIRVTTIAELSTEVMAVLPNPQAAAMRLKRALQGVFEAHYAFDLEELRKQNIGKAVARLEKYQGVTPFAIHYVTQCGLSGHAIAVDEGSLRALQVLGVISEAEAKKGHVPGMERAIPKSKGTEFCSLLHQLGADLFVAPYSSKVRGILLEIDPEAKDRLPKRGKTKTDEAPSSAEPAGPADQAPAAETAGDEEPRKKSGKTDKDKDKERGKDKPSAADSEQALAEASKKKLSTKRLVKKKPR